MAKADYKFLCTVMHSAWFLNLHMTIASTAINKVVSNPVMIEDEISW